MGVTLERVQNKFACIIGELCSEPGVLSQFAIWLDLRLAEYKAKGAISLECSGDYPDPSWLKGHKFPPQKVTQRGVMRSRLPPQQSTTVSVLEESEANAASESLYSSSFIIKEEVSAASVFPVTCHENENATTSRKRRTSSETYLHENTTDMPHFNQELYNSQSVRKVQKLDSSSGSVPSVANESLLSIISDQLHHVHEQDHLSENSSDTIETDFSMQSNETSRCITVKREATCNISPNGRGREKQDDSSIRMIDVLDDSDSVESLTEEQPCEKEAESHNQRSDSDSKLAELGLQEAPDTHPFFESVRSDPPTNPEDTSEEGMLLSRCSTGTCNCKVEISKRRLNDIRNQFISKGDPTRFFLKLMGVAFTKDELASSNLSGLPRTYRGVMLKKKKLCEKRIRAMCICTQRVFPSQWPVVKDTLRFRDHVNGKCRAQSRKKSQLAFVSNNLKTQEKQEINKNDAA